MVLTLSSAGYSAWRGDCPFVLGPWRRSQRSLCCLSPCRSAEAVKILYLLKYHWTVCKISALGFLVKELEMVMFWLQFWISYLLGWSYSTLRKNGCGNSREKGGNTRQKGGNTRADSSWLKHENMKWCGFFLDMVIFILKWTNLQKMDRNQTKICPGKKFVTNEYPGMYICIIYIYL